MLRWLALHDRAGCQRSRHIALYKMLADLFAAWQVPDGTKRKSIPMQLRLFFQLPVLEVFAVKAMGSSPIAWLSFLCTIQLQPPALVATFARSARIGRDSFQIPDVADSV